MTEIPVFYKKRLRQLSQKYEVPLDILSPDPVSLWDSKNPQHSYQVIKNQIRYLSPVATEIEAGEMYRDYLREQREAEYRAKAKEIKKVEKKIKKERKSHVIHVKKGKKHYPYTIYINGKVLSYSPTKKHAVEVKNNFIQKIRHYNKNQRDSLMIPTIVIKGKKGIKTLKGF